MIFAKMLKIMWDNVPEVEKSATCLVFKLYAITFFNQYFLRGIYSFNTTLEAFSKIKSSLGVFAFLGQLCFSDATRAKGNQSQPKEALFLNSLQMNTRFMFVFECLRRKYSCIGQSRFEKHFSLDSSFRRNFSHMPRGRLSTKPEQGIMIPNRICITCK